LKWSWHHTAAIAVEAAAMMTRLSGREGETEMRLADLGAALALIVVACAVPVVAVAVAIHSSLVSRILNASACVLKLLVKCMVMIRTCR